MTPAEFAARVAELYPDEWPGAWERLLDEVVLHQREAEEAVDAVPQAEHERLLKEAADEARNRDVKEAVAEMEAERDDLARQVADLKAEVAKLQRLLFATGRSALVEAVAKAARIMRHEADRVEQKRMPPKADVARRLRWAADELLGVPVPEREGRP